LTWVQSQKLTFRIGLFDGVAGTPSRPRAFFAERLKGSDGVFLIGQADWQLTKNSRLEAGTWAYTAGQIGPDQKHSHDHGAYLSYEAPLSPLPRLQFWVRGGVANAHAQAIGGYIGAGLVQKGTFPGRENDRLGIAIAHAIIGDPAVSALGVHHAETSLEATYQAKISDRFVIQPDFDYIRHPAAIAGSHDSLGVGVRFVYASAYPTRMEASDPGDPTIPPDGAPPATNDSSDQP
jgi:porin